MTSRYDALSRALAKGDAAAVRSALVAAGLVVPRARRRAVWELLLKKSNAHAFSAEDVARVALDLPNQRVIKIDAERTRADVDAFRTPEMRLVVCRLLTLYCKRADMKYKQGLNELLAPFLLVSAPKRVPPHTALGLFSRFVSDLLPKMFVDDDFFALQGLLSMFHNLLLFHDPELALCLDDAGVIPELFATPWFVTLFAMHLPVDELFKLWELYLILDDNTLHMFVALSFVLFNRETLLSAHASDLPICLTSAIAYHRRRTTNTRSEMKPLHAHLLEITTRAIELNELTPSLFKDELRRLCFDTSYIITPKILESIENEIVLRSDGIDSLDDSRVTIVDCRDAIEFKRKRITGIAWFDPAWTFPAREEKFAALREHRAASIILVGNSTENEENARNLLLQLIQRNFNRVSIYSGGFDKLCEDFPSRTMTLSAAEVLPARDLFTQYAEADVVVDSTNRSSSRSLWRRFREARAARRAEADKKMASFVSDAFEETSTDDECDNTLEWTEFPCAVSGNHFSLSTWRSCDVAPKVGLTFFSSPDASKVLVVTPSYICFLRDVHVIDGTTFAVVECTEKFAVLEYAVIVDFLTLRTSAGHRFVFSNKEEFQRGVDLIARYAPIARRE